MTFIEQAAIAAMQAILSRPNTDTKRIEAITANAVNYAIELAAELEKIDA